MGPSKSPNKIEREWMTVIADHGCIACLQDGHRSPALVHHIVQGNRRLGHLFTLPLCPLHHQGDGRMVPSVHFAKRQFVALANGKSTSDMTIAEMTAVIDLAHAFGTNRGVQWSPTSLGRGVEA
jgi:hypothetical protein